MNDNDNALSPTPTRAVLAPRAPIPSAPPAPLDSPETWPTSLDLSTTAGKIALVKLSGVAQLNVAEAGDSVYRIVGYVMHPDSRADEETGEISEYTRTAFLTDDGRTIASTGMSVTRKWLMIVRMMGNPSVENPIPVTFAKVKSRRPGRTFDDVELVAPF